MKIAIIRLSSFGDLLFITPVLKNLKEKYPQAVIDVIVYDVFKAAIEGNPNIDNLIIIPKGNLKRVWDIKNEAEKIGSEYDLIIDLHSKLSTMLLSYFMKGKVKITNKKRSLLQALLVKLRLIRYFPKYTIVQGYYKTLAKFGLKYEGENLEFYFEENDLEKVSQYNGYIAMSTGASKYTKRWPNEAFVRLAQLIYSKYGIQTVFLGSTVEGKEIDLISNGDKSIINLCGKLTLKESGALLSGCRMFIGNDSALFNIARAFDKDIVAIFGPTSQKMFDLKENITVVTAGIRCSPCSLHGDKRCPKKHFKCMMDISPDEVFEKVSQKYEGKK